MNPFTDTGRMILILKRILLVALVAIISVVPIARAQIIVGDYNIFQNGVKVGEIYVPYHRVGAPYVEHWVVSSKYRYSGRNIKTEIVANDDAEYSSEKEFFSKVSWKKGSRYIQVKAVESTPRMASQKTIETTQGPIPASI